MLQRREWILAVVMMVTSAAGTALAADKPADKKLDGKAEAKKPAAAPGKAAGKIDGTWTWTFTIPSGQTMEPKLTLKLEGDKLTGTITGRNGENPISDGKFDKDGSVSFKVVRERDGRTFTANYSGKLEGDAIKGTQITNFGGEEHKNPWDAKRVN